MKEMSFGVAVVTCNRLNLLKECVDAINSQEVPFSKIAIVNNNSNDGTKDFLDSISDERYCIVHSSENLGGAGGFHLALKQFEDQSTDWVLIIDDDAIIRPDFIKEMKKAIEAHKDQYKAYAGVVYEDGVPNTFHRKKVISYDVLGEPVSLDEYKKATFVFDVASFCGLLIHSNVIQAIGLPRKDYFIWHDDTEYSLRINKLSRILNVNTAGLDHKRKPGASDVHDWKNFYGFRNELDLFKQYSKRQYYKEIVKMVIRIIKAKKAKDYRLVEIYSAALKANLSGKFGVNTSFLPGKK